MKYKKKLKLRLNCEKLKYKKNRLQKIRISI